MLDALRTRQVNGGKVMREDGGTYRLELPTLHEGKYGLSQVDDYMHLARFQFPHTAPTVLKIEARVSQEDLCGTWGFGLWNDPFSIGLGAGGMAKLLPVLPNAVWFFYGSPPNYLSLRDDLPASGFHIKTFRSPLLPAMTSIFGILALPFLFWSLTARVLRRFARWVIKEDACELAIDVTAWHSYQFTWQENKVLFEVDHKAAFETMTSPRGRLGLVIWIDNQYFYFKPNGKIGYGALGTKNAGELLVRNLILIS